VSERRRLETVTSTGVVRDRPAERHGLRRVVDRAVSLLRRCSQGTINQVQLVTRVGTIDIVANSGTVAKTEGLTVLLTNAEHQLDGTAVPSHSANSSG
jgi:hypothetical protein